MVLVGGMRALTGATSSAGAGRPWLSLDDNRSVPVRPPFLRPATPDIRRALIAQATNQIKALRAGDFEKALEFTVPGARGAGAGEQFGKMLKAWYPALLKPGKTTFGTARGREKIANLEIALTDKSGDERYFLYSFVEEQGTWYIESCILTGLSRLSLLSAARRISPNDGILRSNRAADSLRRKDYAAAAPDIEVLARQNPQNMGAYAVVLKKSGNRAGYLRERERIIAAGLRAATVSDRIATSITNDSRASMRAVQEVEQADAERASAIRFLVVDALSEPASARLLGTMIESLRKAAEERPRSSFFGSNREALGLALCGAGQYKQTIEVLTAGEIEYWRGDLPWAALALSYARTGDKEKARRARLRVGTESLNHFSSHLLASPLALAADQAMGLRPGQIIPSPDPLPRPADRPESWRLQVEPGISVLPLARQPDGSLLVTVSSNVTRTSPTSAERVRLYYPNVVLAPGRRYSIEFLVRADQPYSFLYRFQNDFEPYNSVGINREGRAETYEAHADMEWTTVRNEFMADRSASLGEDSLTFYIGQVTGMIWFRDIIIKPLPEQDKGK